MGFSLQSLPLEGIARPSRGRFAPLWLSTDVPNAASWIVLPPVSPTPTLSRGCLVPQTTMDSLFTHRSALPGHPESKRQNSSVPPASPTSKPSSSSESVRADLSCPKSTVDPLLTFCPSRAFSFHVSNSQPAPATRTVACPFARGLQGTVQRTVTPLEPGEAAPLQKQ
jgi:hypothetical protein